MGEGVRGGGVRVSGCGGIRELVVRPVRPVLVRWAKWPSRLGPPFSFLFFVLFSLFSVFFYLSNSL